MQCTRNRHYDPKTGRFTQEDANGIAGGLNLYGFADGDPITYTDPFGLAACDPPKKPCEEGSHATLTVGATALLGIGQAVGISLGFAIDTKLDIVGYLSIHYGVGGGGTAGLGAGIQTGGVESVAHAATQLDGNYHSQDPTTVTIAVGLIQPSGTIPGKGDNSGAGLAFSSARLGAGGGVFVTQQHTITTPVMRPFARPIATVQNTVYGWVYNAHRFARCQVACMP